MILSNQKKRGTTSPNRFPFPGIRWSVPSTPQVPPDKVTHLLTLSTTTRSRKGESEREIFRMASMVSMVGAGICSYSARPSPSMAALKSGGGRRSFGAQSPFSSSGGAGRRRVMVVRADTINPEIRKTEDKVVDSVLVAELAKPVTAYCRCFFSFYALSVCFLRNTRKGKEKKRKSAFCNVA